MYGLQVTTPTDRQIVMTRALDAPRDLVFRAFTEPKLISRWLLGPDGWSMPICEVDLRVGGAFRYRWRNDENGQEFGQSGTFNEIVRPDRIVHTEKFDEGDMPEATTTTTFVEHDGATMVTMTLLFDSRETRDAAIESGMESDVAASYDRLAGILAAGP